MPLTSRLDNTLMKKTPTHHLNIAQQVLSYQWTFFLYTQEVKHMWLDPPLIYLVNLAKKNSANLGIVR